LLPISPKQIAPNRNQGVLSANPEKAVSNFATPSIQNRKQPRMPAMPWSRTCVIQQPIMKMPIANAECACGSIPSGSNRKPAAAIARAPRRTTDRVPIAGGGDRGAAGERAALGWMEVASCDMAARSAPP